MEPKRTRSSVIARLVGFGEHRPFQPVPKGQKFLSDICLSKVAGFGGGGEKCSTKKDQEETRVALISEARKRSNQPKGLVQEKNKRSTSGFLVVTSTKENFHTHIKRPNSFASKHIIDAQATPPHKRTMGFKSTNSSIFGKTENHRKFGRSTDRRNLKSKPMLKHHNSVDPLKPKLWKKESPIRSSLSREIGSILMFSASRDSLLSLGRIECERPETRTQLKIISAPSLINKDENDDPECPMSSEGVYQSSPISVLEQAFDGQVLEDLRGNPHLDLQTLEQQLETLTSESMNTYSEGSGMVVSSDEESDMESVLDTKTKVSMDREEAAESIGAQESRELAYVDTILAEAGFHERKRVSLDLPIDTIIFEKLEKKFCKQTSWKRSERRLLFDRFNSSLVEIKESTGHVLAWKKPVSRRLSVLQNTHGLKKELRKLLAAQEKQAKKKSSTKVPANIDDRWLELEDDTESVVQELETVLANELMAEAVDLE